MTDHSFDYRDLFLVMGLGGLCVGLIIGAVLGSHHAARHPRKLIEHCVLVDTAPDYRDVQCPSGEWRYIGDTLRIRLHT